MTTLLLLQPMTAAEKETSTMAIRRRRIRVSKLLFYNRRPAGGVNGGAWPVCAAPETETGPAGDAAPLPLHPPKPTSRLIPTYTAQSLDKAHIASVVSPRY